MHYEKQKANKDQHSKNNIVCWTCGNRTQLGDHAVGCSTSNQTYGNRTQYFTGSTRDIAAVLYKNRDCFTSAYSDSASGRYPKVPEYYAAVVQFHQIYKSEKEMALAWSQKERKYQSKLCAQWDIIKHDQKHLPNKHQIVERDYDLRSSDTCIRKLWIPSCIS